MKARKRAPPPTTWGRVKKWIQGAWRGISAGIERAIFKGPRKR